MCRALPNRRSYHDGTKLPPAIMLGMIPEASRRGPAMPDPDGDSQARDLEILVSFLADRDESCPLCGYNLRGLTGERCPECAKSLVLRVGLQEPNLGAFMAGLIALASAAGFCLLMLSFFIVFGVMERGSIPSAYLVATTLGAIFSATCLFIWIRNAKRVRRWTRRQRVIMAIATFMVPLICFAMFLWAAFADF